MRTWRWARRLTWSSWVMTASVIPSWWSSSNTSRIASAFALSRLPVGSSASSRLGSATSARAIATRCRSPPDRVTGPKSIRCASPTRSNATRARAIRSLRGTPTYTIDSATFSSTVRWSSRWNDWKTNPIRSPRRTARRRSRRLIVSTPSSR